MTPETSPITDAPPPARERTGTVALWASGLAMVAGTVVLETHFPFAGNGEELLDLRKMVESNARGFTAWLTAIVLLFGGWAGGILAARGRDIRDVRLPLIASTALVLGIMLATYPGTAIDVYIYAARSHLLTDLGLDPSTTLPETYWDLDPYVRYASNEWADRPSPYGPLWNLVAAPATALDGGDIAVAVMILKGIMVAGVVATGLLIHEIARRVQPRLAVSATIGWLWSPVVLWEGIANGHNDVLLALLLVASLWAWYRGRLGAVLPLLGAAALLKVVAVILIPAALVAIIRRAGWNRCLAGIAWRTTALSLGVLWISLAPFYDFRGMIEAIRAQSTVIVTSPALLVQAISNEQGWGLVVRDEFGRFSTPAIVLLTLIGAIVAWRRPSRLPIIAYEQLFWFLLLATSNLRPWYGIWLVALGVVLPPGMPLVRAAAFAAGALATYAYLLWVQHWFDAEWIVEVSITVGLMVGPVLLATLWAAVRSLRRRSGTDLPSE